MKVEGYRDGVPFDLSLSYVGHDARGGHAMLSEDASSAYLLMAMAASKAGHELVVNSAWRSHDHQRRLYSFWESAKMRWDKGDPLTRGPRPLRPSRPGHSPHESGNAVDIDVFEAGKPRPVVAWLKAHAAEYGFRATVPQEPWHYEFVGARETS